MASQQVQQLKDLHEKFRISLESFAHQHQKEINKNPVLRVHFQKMCTTIGVDPLASSKGFWADILGIGDFYYELGVKIVEACLKVREETGGLVELQLLKRKLMGKGSNAMLDDDDILKAIDTLKPLGSGFKVVNIAGQKMVQSVPREMSTDTSMLLDMAGPTGFITQESAQAGLGWSQERLGNCISSLTFKQASTIFTPNS